MPSDIWTDAPQPRSSLDLGERRIRTRVLAAAGPRRGLLAAAVAVTVLVSIASPATGAADPVAEAESALAGASVDRVAADAAVADVRARLAATTAQAEQLGRADDQLTEELTDARRELREFAVAAYIDGGQAAIFRSSLDPEKAQALSWQASLSLEQSTSASHAAERFADLKASNDPERIAAAEELDRLRVELQAVEFDQIQAAAFERDAESAVTSARAARAAAQERAAAEKAAARAAASSAAASGSGGSSSNGSSGGQSSGGQASGGQPSGGQGGGGGALGNPTAAESATLARIRQCESRGNYSIVSSTGRYRGAYQFDHTTWRAVGGTGDPAAASPQEQDYRALLLLRMRGTRPWPHCGR